jgi:hypothetical protein
MNPSLRTLARERALQFWSLAEDHRRLALAEPLERRRRVLAVSARRYALLAMAEEKIAGDVDQDSDLHDRWFAMLGWPARDDPGSPGSSILQG